jgi:hypothetical protein
MSPRSAPAGSKVTGVSRITTWFSVSVKSWIIGASATGIRVVRTTRRVGPTARCRTWSQVG